MPNQTRRIFKPDTQAGIDRQRRMAEAMVRSGTSGAPEDWNRMPVVPKYGAGNALAQLAEAMGGAFLQKRANQAQTDLDAAERKKLADAMQIDSMTHGYEEPSDGVGPVHAPEMQPAAEARAKALRGFNEQVPVETQKQVLAARAMDEAFPQAPSEYTLGKGDQRRRGSEVIAENPADAKPPKLMQGVGPDGRPIMVPEVEGAQPYVPPNQNRQQEVWQPLTRDMPDGTKVSGRFNNATGQFIPDGAPFTPPRMQMAPKDRNTAKTKLITLSLAKKQLADIRMYQDKLKNSLAQGPGGSLAFWSKDGANFDASVDAFRETISALTRTPGIGAQSDWEGKLAQAKLPSRNDFEETGAIRLNMLDQIVSTLEGGYGGLLQDAGPEPGSAPRAPAAPGAPQAPGGGGAPAGDAVKRANTYY